MDMALPWKTKGIVLTAPLTHEMDSVVRLIEEYLAPNGCNLIVLQTRYRYQFRLHPECQGYDPLSYGDVKRLLAACRRNGIRLLPKMNLLGHQSGVPNRPTDGILHGHGGRTPDIRDGLLRAYPEFDEEPDAAGVLYSRSLCLTNPLVKIIVFDLMSELLEVFEADGIHVGCDEAMNIGLCPQCAHQSAADLFAGWITALHDHAASQGAQLLMWGDRLLNSSQTGYGEYEAAANGTDAAIRLIPKDILICDWHYEAWKQYPSVRIFGDAGFHMLLSPWRVKENADRFIDSAIAASCGPSRRGQIEGLLMTTWCGSGDLSRVLLQGEEGRWEHTSQIAATVRHLFEER